MDITWGASASHEIAWGGMIAVYLFLAGIAAGAFLTAALTDLFGKNRPAKLIRAGAYIPPIAIVVGLLLLVFDLGRPLSFWKLIFNVNFGSVMSLGTFIISFFTAVALVYAYLIWTWPVAQARGIQITVAGVEAAAAREVPASGLQALRKPVAVVGSLLAFGTATYTGFLLSAVSTNTFWSVPFLGISGVPFLPFLFLVSAISTGLAATLIGAIDCSDLTLYKKVDIILLAIEILLLIILYTSVSSAFFQGGLASLFWIGVVVIGLLMPLILAIYGVSKHKNLVVPVCGMVVVGGLALRYFVVYAGQMVR
ncbi:MAG: polysulfide reductase NrfD [Desulfitobacteriaceae bacterium]|nr:polysulfide reductase NrfD [Desulfitobacteriaceae bacterium]MDI6878522.1 polysulfide reductase NrfD [Desulfitobacteriaceae bacterium]MDI6914652.1 polysulfide reductase NrfD [Desulfitobacteriaceae bacterium]